MSVIQPSPSNLCWQEAQLPQLAWLCQHLMLNDDVGDAFGAHESFVVHNFCWYPYSFVQQICTGKWLSCVRVVGCARCYAMSVALAPSSWDQGFGRCAHQLSERAHAPIPCLSTIHEPLEANKYVVDEPCKRRCPSPVVQWGKTELLCWAMARCSSQSKTCTPCFHTSRTSVLHP
jgi:hypothetical protein